MLPAKMEGQHNMQLHPSQPCKLPSMRYLGGVVVEEMGGGRAEIQG